MIDLIDPIVDGGNPVMASDLVRMLAVEQEGGLYLDLDQVIYEYDTRLHYFHLFAYSASYMDQPGIETSFYGAIPHHPAIKS